MHSGRYKIAANTLGHPDSQTRKAFGAAIAKAETASWNICEFGGAQGRACRRGTWRKTACEDCAARIRYTPFGDSPAGP